MSSNTLNRFRSKHILSILNSFDNAPLDYFLNRYFRSNKSIGSKDRNVISETLYTLVRQKKLLDHFCTKPPSWEKRFEALKKYDLENIKEDLPPHIRYSCSEELFNLLKKSYGEGTTVEICQANNSKAPTTIRVNPLKSSRNALLEKLPYSKPCKYSGLGIILEKKINLVGTNEFKNGLFEIQDEGSQLISELVDAKPGDKILDFCAGSGGKTLAFAHKLKGCGELFLHDIRKSALNRAKKRLERAGVKNCCFSLPPEKSMDWIIVDAPCTGTGTTRRHPEEKWKFSRERLENCIKLQRQIFKKALNHLKPNGKIVYSTCSILPEENEEQVEFFKDEFNLKVIGTPLQFHQKEGEMDGFFGVVLRQNNS